MPTAHKVIVAFKLGSQKGSEVCSLLEVSLQADFFPRDEGPLARQPARQP